MTPKAIILFGSAARENLDENSDIDICVIANNEINQEDLIPYLNKFSYPLKRIEVVQYTESQFGKMLSKGSLFVHHLKNEGKIIFGKTYVDNQFQKLKNFTSHLEELEYYIEIFNQLLESRNLENENQMFDGSLLFTIARNTCILLSNYYSRHNYGRRNAFQFCNKTLSNFPLSNSDYSELEVIKLAYERGIINELNRRTTELGEIIIAVEALLNYSKMIFESENEILDLESKVKSIRGLAEFGFKERMLIEKTLFSILTKVAGKNVSGFNEIEYKKLNRLLSDDFNRLTIVRKLFELRKFLKEISGGSAYVRDLALENADTNRIEVFKFLEVQIKGIKNEIKRLSLTIDKK